MLPELNFTGSGATALRAALQRRGAVDRLASLSGDGARTRAARRIVGERRERDRRANDPFERARLFLGRKGVPVFSAAVYDERFDERTAKKLIEASDWIVGKQRVAARADVIALARKEGWGE